MDTYKNKVRVAAHRGNSICCPENTLPAYASALEMSIDQIEVDVHMTKDGEIIMMHDHAVDRTTNGSGLVRNLTLQEIKQLDAGSWKGREFKNTRVPTLVEFLDLVTDYPEMTYNIELKDYPLTDAEWAKTAADKTLALVEKYHLADRIWINCWSGELLEYIDEKYDHRYKLHGYFPFELLHGEKKRHPYDYLHCVCLFGSVQQPVVDKKYFDEAIAAGVEPWGHFPLDEIENYEAAVNNGVMLLTANDPKKAIDYLHSRGLHTA